MEYYNNKVFTTITGGMAGRSQPMADPFTGGGTVGGKKRMIADHRSDLTWSEMVRGTRLT